MHLKHRDLAVHFTQGEEERSTQTCTKHANSDRVVHGAPEVCE